LGFCNRVLRVRDRMLGVESMAGDFTAPDPMLGLAGLAAGLLDFPTADLARYTGADFALTGFPTANFTLTGFMASSSTTMGSVAAWSWSLP
jgi:hypothetical protein